ncbi:MAG: hypothetical protein NVSMB64_15490 [Candidatus Velthaea sp.]
MPNPTIPGVVYPTAYDTTTLTAFIANNFDTAISSPGSTLVYALPGAVSVNVNNIALPQLFNVSGPLVVSSSALLSQLVNSGVRMSVGFTSTFLPNLQTTIAKSALLAQTPAQTQTALNSVVAAFIASPLS